MRRVSQRRRTTRHSRRKGRGRRVRSALWDIREWHAQLSPVRRRLALASAALTAVAVIFGGMVWADIPARVATATRNAIIDVSLWAGFSVRAVYVAGRKEATRPHLLSALDTRIGDPILLFDPETTRQRLLQLGWIADARVERRLPDTIMVYLKERKPVAIWQRNKRFVLVDGKGAVIGPEGLNRYRHLKIIVGEDAPKHTAALLAMLRDEPDMMNRVTHAIWVSGRRWNIRIEDAIDVRLPAENPEVAWRKLIDMERQYGLLKRDISAIDLRVPDRVTVRANRSPAKAARQDGQT